MKFKKVVSDKKLNSNILFKKSFITTKSNTEIKKTMQLKQYYVNYEQIYVFVELSIYSTTAAFLRHVASRKQFKIPKKFRKNQNERIISSNIDGEHGM